MAPLRSITLAALLIPWPPDSLLHPQGVYDSDVEEAVQEQAAAAAKRSASSSKDAPASKKLKLSTGEPHKQ